MSATKLMPPTKAVGGSWYQSAAAEKEKHVTSQRGTIHGLAVENSSAAAVYAFVYDGSDHTGTLIAGPIPVAAHQVGGFDWRYGIHFQTGLYIGLSDTDTMWTAHAGSDGWFSVGYTLEPKDGG